MSAEPRRRVFRWRSGMPTPQEDLRWLSWPGADHAPWTRYLARVQPLVPVRPAAGAVWVELYEIRGPLVPTPVGWVPQGWRPVAGLAARLGLN